MPSLLELVKCTLRCTDRTFHYTRRMQIALSARKEQLSIPFAPCERRYWLGVRIDALRIVILTDVFFEGPSFDVERVETFEFLNECIWNVGLPIR